MRWRASRTHTAIGASTALFGALGILTAHARRVWGLQLRTGLRRWAPLGAGVMLLAYLGFGGDRTDVGAHVAGFAVGGVLGLGFALAGPACRREPWPSALYAAVAGCLLALAWTLALQRG